MRTTSIGMRLSRVVIWAVLLGIMASVSFFLLNEFRQTIMAEQSRLRSSAAAFAAAAATSVRSDDPRGALLVLRGIRELPDVHYAAARDNQGRIVAEIGQTTMLDGRDGTLEGSSLSSMVTAETLSVTSAIHDGGEVIGSIMLTAGIASLRDRYLAALATSLLFAMVLMALTALIARAQIARIIRPLAVLAGEFHDIGNRSDLTRRLTNDRTDEIGVLIGAFNNMFGQIERRDTLLQRHRDSLEQTVAERTAELSVAKEDAERANAAKSDFLATMSHEIRTPMNGMMVMAEMLSAAALAPKHLRYAEIISRSGRGLLNILNDILDFSKIEAGMLNLEAIPFSIDSIVEDTVSLFAERAREKGLVIALYVDPCLPGGVIGDPTRLNQVIGNLVNNALKFTETGGVTVRVTGSVAASPSGMASIEIHVCDTGIGIASDQVGRIFERFSQADQTITRKFGGTGLGLSISRKLVAAMGSELLVESTAGQGSDFFFTVELPVAEIAPNCTRLDGKRVNIAAASALVTAAVEKALVRRGAKVVATEDERPDVVLVQAGCEAASVLAGVPVVLMRPFAVPGGPAETGIAGEISLPLGRAELEVFSQALLSGDWQRLRLREQARHRPAQLPDLGHLKVLAVDDTAVNREVLVEALGGFGIAATVAESGSDAIEKVHMQSFDVIFMDCSMPDMDGFTAAAAIRDFEREAGRAAALVVALTAHVTGPEAIRWREAGMDGYMAKPFTIAQLAEILGCRLSATKVPDGARPRQPAELPRPSQEQTGRDAVPLLASETLAMFATLSGSGGDELASKVFNLFRAHAPTAFDSLAAALDGPPNNAAKHAHALKSMCLSAGAKRAAAACEYMEEQLKTGKAVKDAELVALQGLLAETELAMDAIQAPVAGESRAVRSAG